MAVFFVLLVLIAQIGFLLVTRGTLTASVEAAARRGSMALDALPSIEERLRVEIEATIPGVTIESVSVVRAGDRVRATADVLWTPPGPDLVPIRLRAASDRVATVPP
jgi:hypothetical protein